MASASAKFICCGKSSPSFRERFPGWQCVVSTTTATGYDEANKQFRGSPRHFLAIRFHLGRPTSPCETIKPTLVVLSEGEIWPNFVAAAKRSGVKLAVINGRMSPRSARAFADSAGCSPASFAQLDWIGAQNDEYRQHYESLGGATSSPPATSSTTASTPTATTRRRGTLRMLFGISSDALVWVAGSTQDAGGSARHRYLSPGPGTPSDASAHPGAAPSGALR